MQNKEIAHEQFDMTGEWHGVERRSGERRTVANPVPRVGGNEVPNFDPNNPGNKVWDAMLDPAASRAVLPVTHEMIRDLTDIAYRLRSGGELIAGSVMAQGLAANIDRIILALASPVAGWESMDTAPKDGTEILIRYPLQGNVKSLASFNTVHRHWSSKGAAIFPVAQKCEWTHLPSDDPAPAATPTHQEQK